MVRLVRRAVVKAMRCNNAQPLLLLFFTLLAVLFCSMFNVTCCLFACLHCASSNQTSVWVLITRLLLAWCPTTKCIRLSQRLFRRSRTSLQVWAIFRTMLVLELFLSVPSIVWLRPLFVAGPPTELQTYQLRVSCSDPQCLVVLYVLQQTSDCFVSSSETQQTS